MLDISFSHLEKIISIDLLYFWLFLGTWNSTLYNILYVMFYIYIYNIERDIYVRLLFLIEQF
jgi:hypothetical protein